MAKKKKGGLLSRITHASVKQMALSIVGLFVATWVVRLAAQLGAFDNPLGQVTGVAAFIVWLTSQGWFQWLSGIALGFTAGAWINYKLRVRDIPAFLWHKIHRRIPNLEDVYRDDFRGGQLGAFFRIWQDDFKVQLEDGTAARVHASVVLWAEGRVIFPIFYIYPTDHLVSICTGLIGNLNTFLNLVGKIEMGGVGRQPETTADMIFSGRVFIYYEPILSAAQIAELQKIYSDAGLLLQIRGIDWAVGKLSGDGSVYTNEPHRTARLEAEPGATWERTDK